MQGIELAPMAFPAYVQTMAKALRKQDGSQIASLLDIQGPISDAVFSGLTNSSKQALAAQAAQVISPFPDILVAHVQVLVLIRQALLGSDGLAWVGAFKEQANCLTTFMNRYLIQQTSWALPILYQLCRDLRALSEKADEYQFTVGAQKTPVCSEDTARHINKAFTIVATDRVHKGSESRQRGIYYVAGTSIKCYFKVNRPTLCKNIIRAIGSSANPQPIESYPIGHQVTWRYYMGMLAFLEEDYAKAEEHLAWAFDRCCWSAQRNLGQILHYLIPLRLLRGHLPAPRLLALFPRLASLYEPFLAAVRSANLRAYDLALESNQKRLVERGVWLTLERGREVVVRGSFKTVWLAQGATSRVSIAAFRAGLALAGVAADAEEVECMVANMIFKGYMKGYISHQHQMVVLSAKAAFPALSSRVSN